MRVFCALLLFLFDLGPAARCPPPCWAAMLPWRVSPTMATGARAQQPTQATRSMLNSRSAVVWPSLISSLRSKFSRMMSPPSTWQAVPRQTLIVMPAGRMEAELVVERGYAVHFGSGYLQVLGHQSDRRRRQIGQGVLNELQHRNKLATSPAHGMQPGLQLIERGRLFCAQTRTLVEVYGGHIHPEASTQQSRTQIVGLVRSHHRVSIAPRAS